MNILVLILIFCFFFSTYGKSACESQCYHDQEPRCRTTLTESTVRNWTGVYKIFDGSVNFVCAFRSLPTPVDVRWRYRSRSENRFHFVPCAKIQKREFCSSNENGEHEVKVECLLRLNQLDLTGEYKCEGRQEGGSSVTGHHADIEVIGIESIKFTGRQLRVGAVGHVEIKICANPQPEVFWILPDGSFLQPRQSRGGFSVGPLVSAVNFTTTPGKYEPYCYTNRLVIGKVKDTKLEVIVRNVGETRRLKV
ncbi:Ig-like domain-containing protein [Aphelenchoides besseyi]|nr:Ig-like domain-containing protein [Aphelenchoides besseyi]KAI6210431.1 Ig-like domain-containing protein [Aphelenchoides besseyi]